MNPLAPYYHMSPGSNGLATPSIPRGPAREHDVGQHIRSPLLEEFRNNSKTNKRYELKVLQEDFLTRATITEIFLGHLQPHRRVQR